MDSGSLKRGDYIDVEGEPFRILGIQSVVTSKHTHTKIKFDAIGMFSGNKKAFSVPHDEGFDKVDLIRKHGQLISKTSDTTGQVMDIRDYAIYDAEISKELMEGLNEGDEVTYIDFKGKSKVLDSRD